MSNEYEDAIYRQFLHPTDFVDDSYISAAVTPMEGLLRAGISLHDGQHTVTHVWDVILGTPQSEHRQESIRKMLGGLTTIVTGIAWLSDRIQGHLGAADIEAQQRLQEALLAAAKSLQAFTAPEQSQTPTAEVPAVPGVRGASIEPITVNEEGLHKALGVAHMPHSVGPLAEPPLITLAKNSKLCDHGDDDDEA